MIQRAHRRAASTVVLLTPLSRTSFRMASRMRDAASAGSHLEHQLYISRGLASSPKSVPPRTITPNAPSKLSQ
jgi:hypothetical protein